MIKYIIYIVLFIVAAGLIGGGFHLTRVHFRNKKEMAPYAHPVAVTKSFGKVLVVYYSLSGNTREIAHKIQQKTNGDLYEIKTKEPLGSGRALYMGVRKQLKDKNYPAVAEPLPDFASYDLIFVGAPVWWYTAATPVLGFLEAADFKGKKVVPFSTQGSNPGTFTGDFKANAKNAVVLEGRGFNNLSKKYDNAVDNKISVWLNGLE